MNPITIQFLGRPRTLDVQFEQYGNGSRAVLLLEHDGEEAGEEFCTVSVNMPDASDLLPEEVFYVKDWSENAPVVEELKRQGYLELVREIPLAFSGFVQAYAYRWNENPQPAERSLGA